MNYEEMNCYMRGVSRHSGYRLDGYTATISIVAGLACHHVWYMTDWEVDR